MNRARAAIGRRSSSVGVAITVLAVAGALGVAHWRDVVDVLAAVSPWLFVAAAALHIVTLALRSEAWRLTLASAGADDLTRSVLHRANAAAFVAGTVQSQAALPARVAMLRRLGAERAPPIGQIWLADVPIFALELCVTALLIVGGVIAGRGHWSVGVAAVIVAAAVLLGARLAPVRFARRPIVRGLAVLGDGGRRGALAALIAGIAVLTLARLWLILATCGLPHGLGEIVWVFAALGIFGLLPLGPGAPAGATLAVLGTTQLGATLVAGLMITVTSIVAVAVYALAVMLAARALRMMPIRAAARL